MSVFAEWAREGQAGRPVEDDALPGQTEPASWLTVAERQLASGELSHYAYRLLAIVLLSQHDLPAVAKRLRLSMQQLRDLVHQARDLPPKPPAPRARLRRAKPPPIPGPDIELRERVRVLWQRGWTQYQITQALGITDQTIREMVNPRYCVDGPCRTCAEYALRTLEPLRLARCGHYSVVFEVRPNGVSVRHMTRKQYLEAIREAAGEPTPGARAIGKPFDHKPGQVKGAGRSVKSITQAQASLLINGWYRTPTSGSGWVYG